MTAGIVLLPEIPGRRAFIRRVSDEDEVPDVLDPEGRCESVVLVERALGHRVKMPLEDVRRAVFEAVADEYPHKPVAFCRAVTEVHLSFTLDHFQSPVGLDFRPHIPTADGDSALLYRRDWYLRRKGGRLLWLERDEFTPDFSRWCANTEFARVAIESGLIGGRP